MWNGCYEAASARNLVVDHRRGDLHPGVLGRRHCPDRQRMELIAQHASPPRREHAQIRLERDWGYTETTCGPHNADNQTTITIGEASVQIQAELRNFRFTFRPKQFEERLIKQEVNSAWKTLRSKRTVLQHVGVCRWLRIRMLDTAVRSVLMWAPTCIDPAVVACETTSAAHATTSCGRPYGCSRGRTPHGICTMMSSGNASPTPWPPTTGTDGRDTSVVPIGGCLGTWLECRWIAFVVAVSTKAGCGSRRH